MASYLRDGEEIWLEVYFKEEPPIEIIDKLKIAGYEKSNDGFYIPEDRFESFKADALPHQTHIMQRFIQRAISLEERKAQFINLARQLREVGVSGMDTWLKKYAELQNTSKETI